MLNRLILLSINIYVITLKNLSYPVQSFFFFLYIMKHDFEFGFNCGNPISVWVLKNLNSSDSLV